MTRPSVTITIPLDVRARTSEAPRARPSRTAPAYPPLLVAIARAVQWDQWLLEGRYATMGALAVTVGLEASYVCRLMRLATLAPPIIEAIVAGRAPATLTLERLHQALPFAWDAQRAAVGLAECQGAEPYTRDADHANAGDNSHSRQALTCMNAENE